MKLTTPVLLPQYDHILDYDTNIISFGSCFADRIGHKLSSSGFDSITNPLGISYNPYSIKKLLSLCLDNGNLDSKSYVSQPDIVSHFDIHSALSRQSKIEFDSNIRQQVTTLYESLKQLDILILTFGSAIVYEHIETGTIVNNCHKVSQNNFNKTMLDYAEMASSYKLLIDKLLDVNPSLKIVLTVSPVRHLRHGAIMNSKSKARLILLCEYLEKTFDSVDYFPAYEIVMDELRDYRFMGPDLVHPTEQATLYIWETFLTSFANQETLKLVKEVDKLNKQTNHKPRFPNTLQALLFKKNLNSSISDFKMQHPNINLNI